VFNIFTFQITIAKLQKIMKTQKYFLVFIHKCNFLNNFSVKQTEKSKVKSKKQLNMKRTILFVSLCSLLLLSCGTRMRRNDIRKDSSSQSAVERKVGKFEKILLFSNCNVHYIQGDVTSVRIVGNAKDVENIETACDGTTLTINSSNRRKFLRIGREGSVDVYITSPDLISVTVKGAGGFDVKGKLDTDTLDVNVDGAGDIKIPNVICDDFNTILKGAGDVDVDRLECSSSDIQLFGAGDINIRQFNVNNSDISVFGVGDVDIDFNNCNKVKCKLFGVGDISLKGNVKELQKELKGTGSINVDKLHVLSCK